MIGPIPVIESLGWDEILPLFETSPQDAVSEMINYIHVRLSERVNTKRLIEKANQHYVDMSFQRLSTQLTALTNQKVLINRNDIDAQIGEFLKEIDAFRDSISHEFADIKSTIHELLREQEDVALDREFAPGLHDQQRSRLTPAMPKGNPGRNTAPSMMRARNTVQKGSVQTSLELRPVKHG
jgi:hypothetical protein